MKMRYRPVYCPVCTHSRKSHRNNSNRWKTLGCRDCDLMQCRLTPNQIMHLVEKIKEAPYRWTTQSKWLVIQEVTTNVL